MKQFTNNARVCFVGDSITHLGIYVKHASNKIVVFANKHYI